MRFEVIKSPNRYYLGDEGRKMFIWSFSENKMKEIVDEMNKSPGICKTPYIQLKNTIQNLIEEKGYTKTDDFIKDLKRCLNERDI